MMSISRLQESVGTFQEENETLVAKNQILSQQVQSLHFELNQISERHAKDVGKIRYYNCV